MAKQILFSESARDKMKKGVDQLADAVRITLGPKGRNAILDKGYGAPTITKDGVSVAREVELEDKFENLGAELVKEVASKTSDIAGDGTTTATVLAKAIIAEGLKNVTAGANPLSLKEGIDLGVKKVVAYLEHVSKKVDAESEIEQVASISANSKDIGKVIAGAMKAVGNDGVITVEESQSFGIDKDVVEGMQFDKGYVSPYMITNADRMEAVYENAQILITDQKVSSLQDLLPLLESLAQATQKELVIIADDIDGEALATLVVNKIRGAFSALAVKAPGFGDRKKEMLADIATLTGAKVVSEEVGLKLSAATIDILGEARKVISTKETTTIVEGKGEKTAIQERVKLIKNAIDQADSDFDKDKLKERLAKLSGGVAVIKVGAATETEMKEMKDRIDDAVHATKAAVEEGIVVGGGVAYLRALDELDSVHVEGDDKIGLDILKRALSAPIKQIASNAGEDGAVVAANVRDKKGNYGYDARKGEYGDLLERGIVDPTKVTRSAIQNAASAAGLFLTTEVAITDIPEEKGDAGAAPGGMPGMGGMGGMM